MVDLMISNSKMRKFTRQRARNWHKSYIKARIEKASEERLRKESRKVTEASVNTYEDYDKDIITLFISFLPSRTGFSHIFHPLGLYCIGPLIDVLLFIRLFRPILGNVNGRLRGP